MKSSWFFKLHFGTNKPNRFITIKNKFYTDENNII